MFTQKKSFIHVKFLGTSVTKFTRQSIQKKHFMQAFHVTGISSTLMMAFVKKASDSLLVSNNTF